ncbi:MAG: ribonuclease HII [Chloroflexota bacterium]|nr:ribonuclease HII [Chloroflexota bacterium]
MPKVSHRQPPDLAMERALLAEGYRCVAGIDEAGRGPLAGPVLVGAVVLPPDLDEACDWLRLVRDSKQLTPAQRERAFEAIQRNAVAAGAGTASPEEIDALGLTAAVRLALLRAVGALSMRPDFLLCDYMTLRRVDTPHRAVVKGDGRSRSIAAGSIVAKVTRDRLMREYDALYPGFGFARHKGYPTVEHLRALERLGPCPLHRRSFAPVRALLPESG